MSTTTTTDSVLKLDYKSKFINEVKPAAIEAFNKYGTLPSLTIAQAILESNWGKNHISNNLFGIKWTPNTTYPKVEVPTTEYINGKKISTIAAFRAYPSFSESIADHAKLVGTAARYSKVRTASTYKEATEAISKAGYATDPKYTEKLNSVIEANLLFQIDEAVLAKVGPKVFIEGVEIPCMLVDGVMFVQARAVSDRLSLSLSWDAKNKTLVMNRK